MEYALWNTIALWIIAAFFLVLTIALLFIGIPVALDVKRSIAKLSKTIDEVRMKADPVLFKVQEMADDVQEVTATARRQADRMGSAVENVGDRVDELAALIEVVQDEIEKPLLRTVATLSGAKRAFSRWF